MTNPFVVFFTCVSAFGIWSIAFTIRRIELHLMDKLK